LKKYLSVKECSNLSGVESSTLRFWDEIGLFSPAKRDLENNYRYYTLEQMIFVNIVKVLSRLDIPLKKINEIQNERNPGKMIQLIDQQEKYCDMKMNKIRECYSILHSRRELINYGINVDETEISIVEQEDKAYILGPRNEFKKGEAFYNAFEKFCNQADKFRINLSFPIGGIHENINCFFDKPGGPDYFFSLDPTGNCCRPAGKYLEGFHRGYYGDFGNLPERIAACAKENSLTLFGPVYTIYLHDEICIKDPSQYLAQVCIAVS